MGKSFRWLSGDTNWSEQGGRWFRRVSEYRYHVMELMPKRFVGFAGGDPYTVNLIMVDLDELATVGAAAHSRGWYLQGSGWDGTKCRFQIYDVKARTLIATGDAAVRATLVDAIADMPAPYSHPIASWRGENHTALRRMARERSVAEGDRDPPATWRDKAEHDGTRCPDCSQTRCPPDCPSNA